MVNRSVVGIALAATISSGCVIVRLDDKFTREGGSIGETPFDPCVVVAEVKLEHDVSQFYFPLVRIDNRRLPHDLVVNLYNQTQHHVGPDIESATFDSIEIVYSDGHRKTLLDTELPESERTFTVAATDRFSTKDTQVRFADAVDRADSFVLRCNGTAVSQSGSSIPFQTELRYRYDGKSRGWYTLTQEICSGGGI